MEIVHHHLAGHERLRPIRRVPQTEDRELRDGDVTTACAESCPTRAIVFGDLDDRDSRVSKLTRNPRAFRLQEDLGTEPKVIYLAERSDGRSTDDGTR